MKPRITQTDRVLRLLIDAGGDWVALPRILALNIAQYGARLYSLRRQGYRIENKSTTVAGVRRTAFRLVTGPTANRKEPETARDIQPVPADSSDHSHVGVSESLFGDISRQRSCAE
ncbi:MAG: hypothetical protein WAQ52_07935 [Terriglobales bacterium]